MRTGWMDVKSEIFSVFLHMQPENNRKSSQMLLLEAADGLFLGHTFACDSRPIRAAVRSTMEVAGASCTRLTLKVLWRWPTFYTWLQAQREKGLLSDPEQRWPEDNLLWSKKGIPSLNTGDQNTDLSHLKGGPRTKAVSNNGSTSTLQIRHGF